MTGVNLTRKKGIGWTLRLVVAWLAVSGSSLCAWAQADTNFPGPETLPPVESRPVPDSKRLFALGMIETGNDDRGIGIRGEVSRYQIQPSVWKCYNKSADYGNPEVAMQVAAQHWAYLAGYFKDKTGREPDDFDMYVLWNTKFGYYARKGFSPKQVSSIIQDRAQRFVNLVNRKG